MNFDLAVLDLAGTTVYDGDAVNTCLQEAMLQVAKLKIPRDDVNQVMGIPKPIAIASLLTKFKVDGGQNRIIEILEDFEERMGSYYASNPAVREVPGTSEVFRQLKSADIQISLDTGFSRRIAQIVIDRLNWESKGLIDASITSDEVKAGRPAPDMIYRAMELTGVSVAGRVIKVGDTPADLQQGAAAGCGMNIGVTEGSHTLEQLRPFPHTHLIGSIRELPVLLGLANMRYV